MQGWASDNLQKIIVNCHSCPIHSWVGGPKNAPCVALLHGALLDHNAFDAQVGPLLSRYRLFLWDSPGHGKSQPIGDACTMELLAADLWAALDAAGMQDVALLGHSAGGFIAQFAQMDKPDRVWAMALASSCSVVLPYSKSAIRGMRLTSRIVPWLPWKLFVHLTAHGVARSEKARKYTRESAQPIGRRAFRELWRPIESALTLRGRSPGPSVPSLLLLGQDDKVGQLQTEMPRWASSCPDSKLVVIANAGHNVMQDDPDTFNREILDFLDSHQPTCSG